MSSRFLRGLDSRRDPIASHARGTGEEPHTTSPSNSHEDDEPGAFASVARAPRPRNGSKASSRVTPVDYGGGNNGALGGLGGGLLSGRRFGTKGGDAVRGPSGVLAGSADDWDKAANLRNRRDTRSARAEAWDARGGGSRGGGFLSHIVGNGAAPSASRRGTATRGGAAAKPAGRGTGAATITFGESGGWDNSGSTKDSMARFGRGPTGNSNRRLGSSGIDTTGSAHTLAEIDAELNSIVSDLIGRDITSDTPDEEGADEGGFGVGSVFGSHPFGSGSGGNGGSSLRQRGARGGTTATAGTNGDGTSAAAPPAFVTKMAHIQRIASTRGGGGMFGSLSDGGPESERVQGRMKELLSTLGKLSTLYQAARVNEKETNLKHAKLQAKLHESELQSKRQRCFCFGWYKYSQIFAALPLAPLTLLTYSCSLSLIHPITQSLS